MENETINVLLGRLSNLEERVSRLEERLTDPKKDIFEKKTSIREFILSKNPKSEAQTGLLIAYYLEKYDGKESFTVKDIADGFRFAKEPQPANISDVVLKNARKAFFDELKEKNNGRKLWILTNAGIKEVERE